MDIKYYLMIIFFGIGDLLTTYLALQHGTEMNPIGVYLLQYGFWPLIVSKIVVIGFVYVVCERIDKWAANFAVWYCVLLGVVASLNNLVVWLG